MAKPGRSIAYADKSSAEVGDAISFALDDTNWTENPTSFEVNLAPPGFTLVGGTLGPNSAVSLGGVAGCKMLYNIFVRGKNAEGFGLWFPLQWTVSTAEATARTLFGLPLEWPATPQQAAGGSPSVIFTHRTGQSPSGARGIMYVNDIDVDGTAAKYNDSFRGLQLLSNGVGAVYLKASDPGWEVIHDTNG